MDAAELDRIMGNLASMRAQGAPDGHLDVYLKSEGFPTLASWQKAAGIKDEGPSLGRRALDAVGDAALAAGEGVATATGYVGSRAVRAAGGIAGIPKAVGEGIDWVSEKTGAPVMAFGPPALMAIAKDYLPSGKQVGDAVFETTGLPEIKLEGNVRGGKIIDAGVEGLLSAPLTGGASIPALMAGAIGGAGSEAAGQWAEGTPYEIPARVGGAIVGGGVGAGTALAGKKAIDVIKSATAPFTGAGRERLAGTALRNSAANADDAVVALDRHVIGKEAFPDAVPGFQIDAGRASRDPGLMAMADVMPDKVRGAMAQNNNRISTEALDKAFAGLPSGTDAGSVVQKVLTDRFKKLTGERTAAAGPLYEKARASTTPVDPTDAWVTARTVADEGKGKPAAMMGKVAGYFESGAETPAKLMATREAVGTLLDNPNLDKHRKSLLIEVRNKIDDAMAAVPEELQARTAFKGKSVPLEPFGAKTAAGAIVKKDRFGKEFVQSADKATADLSGKAVQNILMAAGGDPVVKQALQSAFFADFKKAALSSVQEDAAGNRMILPAGANKWLATNKGAARNVLTDDQVRALDDVARNLTNQAQTVPGRTNSATFDRLATESILGALVSPKYADAAILHPVRRALGLVYGGANEQTLQIVMDAIADPKTAAALMKKATAGNVKLAEPFLQQIARGATVPASTSGERGSR